MTNDAPLNFEIKLVAIASIRIEGGTQTRAGIRADIVEEYADVLATGADLPPAVVFDDGAQLWMGDGFHRAEAYLKAGKKELPVEVKKGPSETHYSTRPVPMQRMAFVDRMKTNGRQ